jgi:PhoH-like ATPase
MKKTFVLDTNVILHDNSCIYQFQDNDIVIPITVLEELDKFKKGSNSLNYHARSFLRKLDELSQGKIFNGGVPIGNGHGYISIKLEQPFNKKIENFDPHNKDHQILNIAVNLIDENSGPVVLVSKDVNLRMKAKSVGCLAQDFTKDHIEDLETLYTGARSIDVVNSEIIDMLYTKPYKIDAELIKPDEPFIENEYYILLNGRQSVLATYDGSEGTIKRVEKQSAYSIIPKNSGQTFALNALMNNNIKLVSVSGKAGTGKTLLALAGALESRKYYQQIFISRPIVPLSNKDIGYLPGDIESKIKPYMQPLHDNLTFIQNQFDESNQKHKHIQDLIKSEKLKIEPLTYIRGRSFVKIFFIVDEAQNLTPHEVKTIITRAGEGTKIIFTGDIYQIDHPYLDSHSNGLSYLIQKMKGQRLYAHINLEKGERSDLAELASNLL